MGKLSYRDVRQTIDELEQHYQVFQRGNLNFVHEYRSSFPHPYWLEFTFEVAIMMGLVMVILYLSWVTGYQ